MEKLDFVGLMTHGRSVPLKDHLLDLLPRSYNMVEEGNRTFYRVGKFKGPIAAWDDRLEVGYIRDDYRQYIMEERAKRSER